MLNLKLRARAGGAGGAGAERDPVRLREAYTPD
jgi:hypothetical protein